MKFCVEGAEEVDVRVVDGYFWDGDVGLACKDGGSQEVGAACCWDVIICFLCGGTYVARPIGGDDMEGRRCVHCRRMGFLRVGVGMGCLNWWLLVGSP